MEYSNELYHHGIKGMRWGIRRYQNKDGSLTPAGEKRRAKLESNLNKLSGKSQKSGDSDENVEAKKVRILESRSAKQLYDNANLFTYNELQAAKMRLELERNIKNLEPAQVSKGEAFANKFVKTSDSVSNVINSGTKTYNGVAKIFNSLYRNDRGTSLPLISDKATSKLDKFKEETEWQKAKNERKKALEEAKEKQKTDLDKLREETAWIDAQNKNREAKRASRAHDEKDRRESEKQAKEQSNSSSNSSSNNSSNNNRGQSATTSAMSNLPALTSKISSSTVNSGRSAVETMFDVYDRDGSYVTTTTGTYTAGDDD